MAMSRSLGARSLTRLPSILISPPLTSSSPAIILSSVDLPQPEGPTSTMNSPSLISRSTPCRTCTLPKLFWTFWMLMEAIGLTFHGAGREALDEIALDEQEEEAGR